jgi:hypothetical protein
MTIEIMPELKQHILVTEGAVQSPDESVAFRIRRRDFFMGKWLKHVQATPYYLRLFSTGEDAR